MDIKEMYSRIIPPDNYKNRRDFDNCHLIDELNNKEKKILEGLLIEDLRLRNDLLIIESLAYIKSQKSIPIIQRILDRTRNPCERIIIAWSLFSLNPDQDDRLVDVAYDSFQEIDNDYSKTKMFFYLAKFNSNKLNEVLEAYTLDSNILLAYNSKAALKLKT